MAKTTLIFITDAADCFDDSRVNYQEITADNCGGKSLK